MSSLKSAGMVLLADDGPVVETVIVREAAPSKPPKAAYKDKRAIAAKASAVEANHRESPGASSGRPAAP